MASTFTSYFFMTSLSTGDIVYVIVDLIQVVRHSETNMI